MRFGLGHIYNPPKQFTFVNAEAEALVAAMSVQPSDARKLLIDQTISTLKGGTNPWADLDGFFMWPAHTEQASRLNWKNPTNTVTGGNSFSADTGYSGGTMTNADLLDNTVRMGQNSAMFGVYTTVALPDNALIAAATNMLWSSVPGGGSIRVNVSATSGNDVVTVSTTVAPAVHYIQRIISTQHVAGYQQAGSGASNAANRTSGAKPSGSMTIIPFSGQKAFFCGQGFSAGDFSQVYSAVNSYLAGL